MTYTPPTPLPTFDMSNFNDLAGASWNFQAMLPILLRPWTNTFGANGLVIGSGIILLTVVGIIWLRHEDIAIPMMLILISGCALSWSNLVPIEWQWLVVAIMIVLPMVAIAYSIFRKR